MDVYSCDVKIFYSADSKLSTGYETYMEIVGKFDRFLSLTEQNK